MLKMGDGMRRREKGNLGGFMVVVSMLRVALWTSHHAPSVGTDFSGEGVVMMRKGAAVSMSLLAQSR